MSAARIYDGVTGEDITDVWNIQYGCNGATLRHALRSLGLPTSGTKRQQARRLVTAGLTAQQVNARYGWRARKGTP